MSVTITRGESSVAPYMVLGYKSSRAAGNLIHTIIGRADPDVTIKPAGLRTGTLQLFCLDLATALEVEAIHAGEGSLDLVDTDLPTLAMTYVVDGDIELELDPDTRRRWVVTVGFQEVVT